MDPNGAASQTSREVRSEPGVKRSKNRKKIILLAVIAVIILWAIGISIGAFYLGNNEKAHQIYNQIPPAVFPSELSPTESAQFKPLSPSPSVGGKMISINFSLCLPNKLRIDTAFGSSSYQITGKQNNNCLINYGSEIENPNSKGELQNHCKIPTSLGIKKFPVGETGVDFSSIQQFCNKQ